VASNLVEALKTKGILITTAEKWFNDYGLITYFYKEAFEAQIHFTKKLKDRLLSRLLKKMGIFSSNEIIVKNFPIQLYIYTKNSAQINQEWLSQRFDLVKESVSEFKQDTRKRKPLLTILDAAWQIDNYVHGEQKRDNGQPYLYHILGILENLVTLFKVVGLIKRSRSVIYKNRLIDGSEKQTNSFKEAIRLAFNYIDEIILVIAILHDAIEDYKGEKEAIIRDIRRRLKLELREVNLDTELIKAIEYLIMDGLEVLTKKHEIQETNQEYLDRIIRHNVIYIIIIKLADMLNNVLTPRYKSSIRKLSQYKDNCLDFANMLHDYKLLKVIIQIFKDKIYDHYTPEITKLEQESDASSSPVSNYSNREINSSSPVQSNIYESVKESHEQIVGWLKRLITQGKISKGLPIIIFDFHSDSEKYPDRYCMRRGGYGYKVCRSILTARARRSALFKRHIPRFTWKNSGPCSYRNKTFVGSSDVIIYSTHYGAVFGHILLCPASQWYDVLPGVWAST